MDCSLLNAGKYPKMPIPGNFNTKGNHSNVNPMRNYEPKTMKETFLALAATLRHNELSINFGKFILVSVSSFIYLFIYLLMQSSI